MKKVKLVKMGMDFYANETGDSEQDFLWVDGFDWEEDNPKDQAIIKAIEQEGIDYCAICWHCVDELAKKGGYNE